MVDGLKSFLIYYSLIELHYIYIPRLTIWFVQPTRYDVCSWWCCCGSGFLIMSRICYANIWERRSLLTDDGGRRVFQQQRKIERIVVDEELLITGVSVSEENQRVLNGGVSASWMNDEGLLANGVSTTEKNERLLVFQQQKEVKQVLDRVVLSMMEGERMKGCW